MELCKGGDVLKKIEMNKKTNSYLREETIWRYLINLICGLKSLHDRKIVHRDIKCANLFLDQNNSVDCLKLGDLNVSKVLKYGLL